MNFSPSPDNILFEDDQIMLVLDIDPIAIGHALILPKAPCKDLDELPPALLQRIMVLAQAYIKLLKQKYSPRGYSMMQNGGDFNDIGQFHLHVFPRFSKEEFSWSYGAEVAAEALAFREIKEFLQSDFFRILEK